MKKSKHTIGVKTRKKSNSMRTVNQKVFARSVEKRKPKKVCFVSSVGCIGRNTAKKKKYAEGAPENILEIVETMGFACIVKEKL